MTTDADYDPFDVALGRKLRSRRALHALRLKDAGRRVGLSESALSAYELGKRRPGTPALRHLAVLYGVQVGDMMPTDAEVDAVQAELLARAS